MTTTAPARRDNLDLLEGDIDERIAALGLGQNVADILTRGYTVVRNAAPIEFFDRLRARILELVEEQRRQGAKSAVNSNISDPTSGEMFDGAAWMLLGRGRVFEEAVCNPYFVTLTEAFVGKGFQIGVCGGTVKGQGSTPLGLHTDLNGVPEPYPVTTLGLTSLWACDDWTVEGGATVVVPYSMRHLRAPISGEGAGETVPIECPKGSIMFWNAATWHGASSRTIPGLRVGFHTPCKQVWLRSLESYADLPDEIVQRNPPVLGRMIGREDVFGKQTPTATAPAEYFRRMGEWNRQRRY